MYNQLYENEWKECEENPGAQNLLKYIVVFKPRVRVEKDPFFFLVKS